MYSFKISIFCCRCFLIVFRLFSTRNVSSRLCRGVCCNILSSFEAIYYAFFSSFRTNTKPVSDIIHRNGYCAAHIYQFSDPKWFYSCNFLSSHLGPMRISEYFLPLTTSISHNWTLHSSIP